jgi:hypothetical protein
MANGDFTISITADTVDVRHTPSESSPRGKLLGFITVVGAPFAMTACLLFVPDRHGSNMWSDMLNASFDSSAFIVPLALLAAGSAFLAWTSYLYARAAWPSDETFHCDREVITISRVPWLDFGNHTWQTHVYPLRDVHRIRFAIIGILKGTAFYGLRFDARGGRWTLPGLEAPQAKAILPALKALGDDVPDDPKLEKKVKETLSLRDGDTSWLDRSWMDRDKR